MLFPRKEHFLIRSVNFMQFVRAQYVMRSHSHHDRGLGFESTEWSGGSGEGLGRADAAAPQ
jgi:hypothetical protein